MIKIILLITIVSLLLIHPAAPAFAQEVCKDASCGHCGETEVWTAFGCISTDPSGFIGSLLSVGIGIAGGIAFLLILVGGFQILTSAGDPEKLNAGREMVMSSIAGLLLIIFSVFLLRFIGFNILAIPGFG
jgi:hypothetical protein